MQDLEKTKDQLIDELNEMRRRVAELETGQKSLNENESRYREIIDKTNEAIFVIQDGCIKFANENSSEIIGYSTEDVLTSAARGAFVHPDDREMVARYHASRLQGDETPYLYAFRIVRKDGNLQWVEMNSSLIMWGGKPAALCLMADITDLKREKEALLKSELEFRSMFENSLDGVFVSAPDGRIFMANQAACSILGRTENEICELGRDGILDSTNPRLPIELETRRRVGKVKCELNLKHKTGIVIPVELTSAIFRDSGDEERSIIVFRDITDRKQSKEALRESEQRFRSVFEQGPLGMAIWGLDYRFVTVNERLCEITGYTSDELAKLTFIDITHPDDIDKDLAQAEALVIGAISYYQIEKRYIKKDKEIAWVNLTGSVVRNGLGELRYFLALIEDITAIKKTEQEKEYLRSQLFQSQKMEALGTLVGGIAHDFNNMLQIMLGYSQFLLDDKKKEEPGYKELQTIIETGQGGAELVKKLLAFGQQGQVFPVPLDLNHQISQLSTLISRTLPQVVQIDMDLADGPTTIRADHGQIDQLVMNLAINASEAMPNGGRLNIATNTVSFDDDYCRIHHGVKPGSYLMLSISDIGRGMDKATLAKIFEPFFSTKERGSTRGTGLGLSVVKGIVQQQGGHVTCESEPGKGTTFQIYFPAIEASLVTGKTNLPTLESRGAETILVVEDNIPVAELEQRVLANAGYTVIVANNGQEALDIYQTRKEEILLVILDLLMPEMSGRDCLMELLKIDPSVKVLIASGYAPEDELHKEISPLVKGFVHKPFGISEFLSEARLAMDTKR